MEKTRAQDSKSSSDAVVTGVGVVLFWPALFFIDGDDENTGELGRLKGEFDALEKAAINKNCNIADELRQARDERDRYAEEKRKRNQDTE